MDDVEYTHGSEQDGAVSENGEPESTSLVGKGWDILVGGEEHARELGGANPFDMDLPEDAEADNILRFGMGREVDEAAAAVVELDYPPLMLQPQAISPGVSVELIGRRVSGEVPVTPTPVSPGVAVEIVAEEPELDVDDGPAVEAPPFSIEELTTPPSSLPAAEAAPAATPASSPTRAREVQPFASDSAPFGVELPDEAVGPFGVPVEEPGELVLPDLTPDLASEPPVARAFDLELSRPHDPFEEAAQPKPQPEEELPPSTELEGMLITDLRINALWDEINEAYDQVIADVRGYFSATDSSIRDLKKARELLLAGYEHFDNAEELVKRVKARLRLEEKVRQWGRTRGTWLAVYLVLWLLLLSVGSLTTNRIAALAAQFVPEWMAATFLPGLYGGLGGVVGALWVLIKHIAKKRDFDPIHTPWYVTNPFMGIALGVVTYLIVRVGDAVLTGDTILQSGSDASTLGLYALCVIVGFNQNVLWALVDRVIKAILPADTTTATVEEAATGEPKA